MRFHKLQEFLAVDAGCGYKWTSMRGRGLGINQWIPSAQKFYVGDAETIDSSVKNILEIPKLPFESCVFELEKCQPDCKRASFFVYAQEASSMASEKGVAHVPGFSVGEHGVVDGLVAIVFGEISGIYPLLGYAWFDRSNGKFVVLPTDNQMLSADDKAFAQSTAKRMSLAAIELVFKFLSVMNCSNVKEHEIQAPRALNKKRAASGRPPVYSYKVLVLTARQRRLDALGGAHESPRVHLRRGHIKRRATGNFWWQPCVVGSKSRGLIVKDYDGSRLSAQRPVAQL